MEESTTVIVIVNLIAFAFGYGRLSQKVDTLFRIVLNGGKCSSCDQVIHEERRARRFFSWPGKRS